MRERIQKNYKKVLIKKNGGHNDQLSKKYWGIDRYRIKALEKLIVTNNLTIEYKVMAVKKLIEKKQEELIQRKKKSQPSQIKTGGSTFKNINEKKAWMLIKESGCDKFYVGDAKISEKHCNFL